MKAKIKTFFADLSDILQRKEMLVLPGHLAFFFVLSIVPIITIIFFVATSFNFSANAIMDFIKLNFSKDIVELLTPIIYNNGFSFSNIVFLIITFYLASNGFNSIIIASNTVFNLKNSSYIKRKLKAFLLTFLMVLLFTFILIVPLFGEHIIKTIISFGFNNNLMQTFKSIYKVINVPLTLVVVFFFIKLVYTLAPDDKIPSKYVNKGALFTTILWTLITIFYSYYIGHIAHYNKYYGGLSNIVIIMLWFYLMANVFVIGLALNYRNIQEKIEQFNTQKLDDLQEKVLNSKGIK